MLRFIALLLCYCALASILTIHCDDVPKRYRQAIPLALVQADMLASAKHPSNTDKANTTNNDTLTDSKNSSKDAAALTILHKTVSLYNPSIATYQPQAVWRVDQQTYSNYGHDTQQAIVPGNVNSGTTNDEDPFEEFTRSNHSQEILVGPLKSLPEHPNGNGPQDMKLKGPGGYKRATGSEDLRTINRFKREFLDDEDEELNRIMKRIRRKVRSYVRERRSKKNKKGVRRDGIMGVPYIPNRESYAYTGFSRRPYDESEVMEDEMSSIPSSQPVGMASSFEASNYGPIEDASRSGFMSESFSRSPAPDPMRLQETYERSSNWEPVGMSSRFSSQDQYNLGLPDQNYERSIENDALNVDNRFVTNFFNQERRTSDYDSQNKRNEQHGPSLLDSLGIGQSEVDEKYLSEAKNIQDYLAKSEEEASARSLGHNIRQHNNIQVGSSPELLRESPNVWNMMDSASYTPLSQEAESLLPNDVHNEAQVLQSQGSMGRVFVPLTLDNLAKTVQQEVSRHYSVPTLPMSSGPLDSDKAVPNFPNIVKSFYPNVPYQTVAGASLNPPSMPGSNYRSRIQQPSLQGASYQAMPMMLPFVPIPGMGYQNMMAGRQPLWGPMPVSMFGNAFPMSMPPSPHGNDPDMMSARHQMEEATVAPKEPGMLTVSSADDDEEAKHQETNSTDFEELVTKGAHSSFQRVIVQSRPKNDTVGYLRESVPSDITSMKTAIKEVLESALMAGNITNDQSKAISQELISALLAKENNKTLTNVTKKQKTNDEESGLDKMQTLKSNVAHAKCSDTMPGCKRFKDAGICPFVATFMNGACAKTCDDCSHKGKSRIQELLDSKKEPMLDFKAPNGPSMYLNFDNVTKTNLATDKSGNKNDAVLLKGAKVSGRKLGTCGTGAELNEGDISWDGKTFHKKPVNAVTLAMWVKVHKGGTVNWFASGDGGTTFYTSTKDAIIPSKIWTHVAGTYDSATGLSSIYINGALIKKTQQKKGQKLVQDWLVNGIGRSFGDDSMHYVDELYIFDRALKPIEVRALYSKCTFNRMVIHYGFQKGNNSLILDQSGLQNDAIPIEGAVQKEDCDRCGACLDLTHGLNPTLKIERISMSHIPTRAVSIALWVSMNSTKGNHDLFITQGPLDGSGYRLRVIDGKVRWSVGTDNGETIFDFETKSVTIPETLWSHIIVTYSKETGNVSIYVNGVSKFIDTVDEKQRKLLPRDWETEAKLGDKSFNGFMDEFIMYNWAIDPSEASYIRNYCADHPKLVRFIVHVPLTKRNEVTRHVNATSLKPSDGNSPKTPV